MRNRNDNHQDDQDNGGGQPPFGRNLMVWLVIVLLLAGVFNMFAKSNDNMAGVQVIAYTDFIAEVDKRNVAEVTLTGNQARGTYNDGRTFGVVLPAGTDVVGRIEDKGVRIKAEPDRSDQPTFFGVLLSWFPMLLLIGVWIFFMR